MSPRYEGKPISALPSWLGGRVFVMICGVVAGELRSYGELMEGRVALPRVGAVAAGGLESLPWLVVDAAGREVEPVSRYLQDLALGDASPATGRRVGPGDGG
jgi:hypothetical protein